MASETTTTTANDVYVSAFVDKKIRAEQRPWSVMRGLMVNQAPMPSPSYSWPNQTDPGVAADLTEGTPMNNTALSTGVATATVAQNGQMATVTDLLQAIQSAGGNALNHFGDVLGRSVKEEFEVTAAALLGSFSNTSGNSGSDLTMSQFAGAVNALEGRDVTGPLVAVFHTVQLGDLRGGSGNTPGGILPAFAASQTGAEFLANPAFNQSIMDDLSQPGPSAGQFLGVDIYVTTAVATANSAADRAGAIFRANSALGVYWQWDLRVETHRALDLPGTQIAATSCYGVAEILDREGQAIITDA